MSLLIVPVTSVKFKSAFLHPGGGGVGGTWVDFCWVIVDPNLVTFGQIRNT